MSSSGMPAAIQLEQVTKRYRAGRSRTITDLIASNVDRVRGRSHEVFLPFEGDLRLSEILSKAFMLAADTKIRDDTIVKQLNRR